MGDVFGGNSHRWFRWFLRCTNKRDKETGTTGEENAGTHSGISGIAWRDARNTTRTMAILMAMNDQDEIPEQPRTVIEADKDGCVRWIGCLTPDIAHGLEEPLDVLIWMWADGSLHIATRPTFEPQWSWSPPMFPDRI